MLVVLGVLIARNQPRLGRAFCTAGVGLLWLASLPLVTAALVAALDGHWPLELAAARKADAIVIPGGGVRALPVEYGGNTLGRLALKGTRYGACVTRATGLLVLVTGGTLEKEARAEFDLMRDALANEFGLTVRWIDGGARHP